MDPRWNEERNVGHPRRLQALVLLGTVLVLLLFSGAPASAHAALGATDPDDGSVVGQAPRSVTLTFTESVGLLDDSFRVFGPDQRRVHTGEATARGRPLRHGPGRRCPGNSPRAPTRWPGGWCPPTATRSPAPSPSPSANGPRRPRQVDTGPAEDPLTGGLYDAARYLAYLAAALLVGTAAFALLCRPADTSPLRRPLVAAWWTLLGSTAVLLLLRAPYETGAGPAAAFDVSDLGRTLTSRPGLALLARLAVLLLTAAFLVRLSRRRDPREPAPAVLAAGTALAAALALTWAAAEHASAGIQVPLAMTSSVLHLLATGVWLGGLVALLLTLRRASGDALAEVVPRFSRIAFASVTVLVVTGVYQSWRGLGSLSALTGTSYGRLLLAKLVAVTALLLAAGYSRRWTARLAASASASDRAPAVRERVALPVGAPPQPDVTAEPETPEPGEPEQPEQLEQPEAADPEPGDGDVQRRGLRRSVLIEVAVAAVVLLITTLLTTTLPGRAQAEAAQQSPAGALPPTTLTSVAFDTGGSSGELSGRGTVQVTLDPARVGENGVQAVVYGADKGLVVVPEVRITFTLPSRKVGPIDAELTDVGGYWSTNSVNLPLAGTWTMKTTVRVSDVDQVTVSKQVRIVS